MFVGGFALADAANLDLMAQIGSGSDSGSVRKDTRTSITAFPGAYTDEACKVEFKKAEATYKVAIRTAKEKRDMAVRAKNVCLKRVSEIRKSVSPMPSKVR